MSRYLLATACAAGLALLAVPAHADSATLDGSTHRRVVLHGHLQGQSTVYAAPAPDSFEQARSLTALRLTLPAGATTGSLVVHVTSAVTHAGFQLRLLDPQGNSVGGARGTDVVGYSGASMQSELAWTAASLRLGRYTLELSTLGGTADYTETLTWQPSA